MKAELAPFWVAFSEVVIIMRRSTHDPWSC
jgi:hypothetical protein